jgi:hypothetical protein
LLYIVNNTGKNYWSRINIIFIWEKESSWSKLTFLILFIKTFLRLLFIWRKWGSHWSMYNFNYEYMTFLYVVHVYMFCNVVLYCIALSARVLFAIKIIIIIIYMDLLGLYWPQTSSSRIKYCFRQIFIIGNHVS